MQRGKPAAGQPKYRKIANVLLDEIRRTMGVGEKLPSEARLAARFGVHVLTVREALRVLQEGGVLQRQRAVGTRVVNPLGGIWVSIVCEMDVFSPNSRSLFHRGVIYHVRHLLRRAGLPSRVSIGMSEPGEKSTTDLTSMDFIADVEANRLAGVVAISTLPSEWWLKKLEKQGTPVVGSNPQFPYHAVFDSWDDLSQAVRCLLDFGRDRIAYIGWLPDHKAQPTSERVRKQLVDLESCYALTIHPEWIKADIHPVRPGAGWDEFRELWSSLEDKPNGLIIDDEHLLPDVERALTELQIRVPEDLVIVCQRTHGNHRVPRFPMVFQENDPSLFASRMTECFLRLYQGKSVASPTIKVPRLLNDDALHRNAHVPNSRPLIRPER